LALIVAGVGNAALHWMEIWSWKPQLGCILLLMGVIGVRLRELDTTAAPEPYELSHAFGYFGLVFSSISTYSSVAADFFANYGENTPRLTVIGGTITGLYVSYSLMLGIGIALGCGCTLIETWQSAYSHSPAGLLVRSFGPLGFLGKVASTVLAFGNLAGASAGMYSSALAIQSVGGLLSQLSRIRWTWLNGIVVLVCALAGDHSFVVLLCGFVAIFGWFSVVWLTIFAWEHLLFKRRRYIWEQWDHKEHMPLGIAASVALCLGFTTALLSASQDWLVGPIAALIGPHTVDVGYH